MANQTNSGNRFDAFAKQVARRRFLRDAALLGVATPLAERLLAASGQVAAAATRAQAEPKGGSISIVMTGDEPKLLDAQVDPFDSAAMVSGWLSDMLVRKEKDGTFTPWLATAWQTSDDGRVWTFTLRKDVKFHDGTPLDAAAVKANFDRIADPKTQSGQASAMLGSKFPQSEAVDASTFRLTFDQAYAPTLDTLSQGFFPIWSPTALQKYGSDEFESHLIGTGPWQLQDYQPADHYTLVKNPNYNWAPKTAKHQGPPYLDTITLRWIQEPTTAVATLRSGEADLVLSFPAQNVAAFRGNDAYKVLSAPLTGSPALFVMNTANPPLDDVHVRQALEHAINQSEFVKVLYKGEAIAARGVMYPATPCYWKGAETVYPFDAAQTKSLLEAAGWQAGSDGIMQKAGKPLKLDVVNAFNADLSPLIQSQLKAAGVDANVELVPGPVQLERAIKGDFHLIFQHLAYSDPSVLDLLYNSKNLQPGGWSWTRYKDAKLDQLLSQSTSTIDQTKRCQMLTQAQQMIVDAALVLPIYGRNAIAVMASKVTDFDLGPRATIDGWLYDTYVQ